MEMTPKQEEVCVGNWTTHLQHLELETGRLKLPEWLGYTTQGEVMARMCSGL